MLGAIVALLLLPVCTAADLDFLFVVFDNGESTQLQPSIELMAQLNSGSIAVLALGEPATSVFAEKPYLYTLPDLGIDIEVPNGRADPSRSMLLSDEDLSKVTAKWPKVRVVAPGMAYAMQAQIAGAWEGSAVVECILDGFGLWSDDWGAGRYFVDEGVCSEVLVPAVVQRETLLKRHPQMKAAVIGAPTLEGWRASAGDVGLVRHARATLYGERPGVLLAGGYGEGHAQTAEIFCNASKLVPADKFAYAHHPGLGDEGLRAIRALFKSSGCDSIILTVDRPIELENESISMDTKLASASSYATVSRYSTVGGQSLYIGVPHAYIDGPHPCRENIFSEYIPVVKTGEELADWLKDLKRFDSSILDELLPGLGGDSSIHLARRLIESAEENKSLLIDDASSEGTRLFDTTECCIGRTPLQPAPMHAQSGLSTSVSIVAFAVVRVCG